MESNDALIVSLLEEIRKVLDEDDAALGTRFADAEWSIDWQDGELVIDGLGPDYPALVVKLEVY